MLPELVDTEKTCDRCEHADDDNPCCGGCSRAWSGGHIEDACNDYWIEAGWSIRERAEKHIAELEARIDDDNAVCLCGCSPQEHESLDEDGEQCANQDHVCLRVAPAIRDLFVEVRAQAKTAECENRRLNYIVVALTLEIDMLRKAAKGGA